MQIGYCSHSCKYATVSTHDNGHCIYYLICRNDFVSNVLVSDNMSASIPCSRPHKECKQMVYRQINMIIQDSLNNDVTEIDFEFNETDIYITVISYNTTSHIFVR